MLRIIAAGQRVLWAALLLGLSVTAAPAQQPPLAGNIETSIAQLHQELRITPAQEPQFNAFAQVMRENARSMSSMLPPRPGTLTPVDGLRIVIRMTEARLAGMKRLLPAVEALYSSLSPAQKRTADRVFAKGPGD